MGREKNMSTINGLDTMAVDLYTVSCNFHTAIDTEKPDQWNCPRNFAEKNLGL